MTEKQPDHLNQPAARAAFPPGLHNAYLFSTFNAFSYQVVLNSPMVLYAKTLGASATVLGIIAGMMPLLVIFQIPAANYIPRLGFKRFVYAGWGTRIMFIFAMALVPLTGFFLKAETRLALMLMLLFGFNLSRGISSCAWLPWITALVPAALRGKYLARDAAVQNLASFITFLIAAACLAGDPRSWQFAILFAFSASHGRGEPHLPQTHPRRRDAGGNPRLQRPGALAGNAALPAVPKTAARPRRLLHRLWRHDGLHRRLPQDRDRHVRRRNPAGQLRCLSRRPGQPLVSGLTPGSLGQQTGAHVLFFGLGGGPGAGGSLYPAVSSRCGCPSFCSCSS